MSSQTLPWRAGVRRKWQLWSARGAWYALLALLVTGALTVAFGLGTGAHPAFAAGILVDSGFESQADGSALSPPLWQLSGVPMRAEHDSLRAKNGAISAWIRGPATISYAGAGETASANMTANGSEHTFWIYLDNTTQRRLIEDNASADASKVFTLYFNPTGSALQVYTSRTGNPNGYATGGYTTVGTWGVGWTQFKITYTFTGAGAQTYTLARRANATDPWTPLKGAGATYDIPFRGTDNITATHGLVFKGYQNTSLWVDDIEYGMTSTTTFDVASSATIGGSIAPFDTEAVAYGADSSLFLMTPEDGYFLSDVLADGVSVTTASYPVPTYQFTDVRSYHTIHAVFAVPGTTEMKLGAVTCGSCHAGHNPPPPCERCHQPIGDTGSSHPGVASDWHASADVSGCFGCHNSELTYEHNGRRTDSGALIDCATCHSSTDSDVVAAISAGDTSCAACHGAMAASGGHEVAHESIEADGCSACHSFTGNTFLANHAAIDCDECHVTLAVNPALDYTCGTCHTPSSTPWSLAVGLCCALGAILVPTTRWCLS